VPDNDLWKAFPIPEPYVDEENRFITPGLKHGDHPEAFRLPTKEELAVLWETPEGQAQAWLLLEHYGITPSMNHMKVLAQDYVTRMTMYSSNSDQFKAAVDDLVEKGSRRAALGMSRSMAQQFSSLREIDGNVDQRMVWVDEGDDHTCAECSARAGEIKTWQEWQDEGPPGSRVCLGGAYCRCDLVPID